jgi:hypothetical protein
LSCWLRGGLLQPTPAGEERHGSRLPGFRMTS